MYEKREEEERQLVISRNTILLPLHSKEVNGWSSISFVCPLFSPSFIFFFYWSSDSLPLHENPKHVELRSVILIKSSSWLTLSLSPSSIYLLVHEKRGKTSSSERIGLKKCVNQREWSKEKYGRRDKAFSLFSRIANGKKKDRLRRVRRREKEDGFCWFVRRVTGKEGTLFDRKKLQMNGEEEEEENEKEKIRMCARNTRKWNDKRRSRWCKNVCFNPLSLRLWVQASNSQKERRSPPKRQNATVSHSLFKSSRFFCCSKPTPPPVPTTQTSWLDQPWCHVHFHSFSPFSFSGLFSRANQYPLPKRCDKRGQQDNPLTHTSSVGRKRRSESDIEKEDRRTHIQRARNWIANPDFLGAGGMADGGPGRDTASPLPEWRRANMSTRFSIRCPDSIVASFDKLSNVTRSR